MDMGNVKMEKRVELFDSVSGYAVSLKCRVLSILNFSQKPSIILDSPRFPFPFHNENCSLTVSSVEEAAGLEDRTRYIVLPGFARFLALCPNEKKWKPSDGRVGAWLSTR